VVDAIDLAIATVIAIAVDAAVAPVAVALATMATAANSTVDDDPFCQPYQSIHATTNAWFQPDPRSALCNFLHGIELYEPTSRHEPYEPHVGNGNGDERYESYESDEPNEPIPRNESLPNELYAVVLELNELTIWYDSWGSCSDSQLHSWEEKASVARVK